MANDLKIFVKIGEIFISRYLEPEYNPNIIHENWIEALKFFANASFARQGAAADYKDITIASIEKFPKEPRPHKKLAENVWEKFSKNAKELDVRTNTKNNPFAPKGTKYGKENEKQTNQKSVIELIESLKEYDYNIVNYVRDMLLKGYTKTAYDKLTQISGVNRKITTMFLRDISVIEKIQPPINQRIWLQPIDIWVKRCCFYLAPIDFKKDELFKGDYKTLDKFANWIVDNSNNLDDNIPEKVNMGMWFLSAQICRSKFKLKSVIENGQKLADEIEKYTKVNKKMIGKAEDEFLNSRWPSTLSVG